MTASVLTKRTPKVLVIVFIQKIGRGKEVTCVSGVNAALHRPGPGP